MKSRRLIVAPEAREGDGSNFYACSGRGQAGRGRCPLWVKSGHVQGKKECLLYPRKRTSWFAKDVCWRSSTPTNFSPCTDSSSQNIILSPPTMGIDHADPEESSRSLQSRPEATIRSLTDGPSSSSVSRSRRPCSQTPPTFGGPNVGPERAMSAGR